jgi:hypothetical protein
MDMPDSSLVAVMTQGIGANLTNDEKRAHLIDLNRGHLIKQVCVQEILPPPGDVAGTRILMQKGGHYRHFCQFWSENNNRCQAK